MTRQDRLDVGSLLDMAESVVEAAVHLNSLDHANSSYDAVDFARNSYASLSGQLALQAPTIVKVIKELRLRATSKRQGPPARRTGPPARPDLRAGRVVPREVRVK